MLCPRALQAQREGPGKSVVLQTKQALRLMRQVPEMTIRMLRKPRPVLPCSLKEQYQSLLVTAQYAFALVTCEG
eukprot:m.423323 g.423323  ORF g.423323 m.423323 type:complete len:74 (-) comp21333_c0_seq3:141-362(-)